MSVDAQVRSLHHIFGQDCTEPLFGGFSPVSVVKPCLLAWTAERSCLDHISVTAFSNDAAAGAAFLLLAFDIMARRYATPQYIFLSNQFSFPASVVFPSLLQA